MMEFQENLVELKNCFSKILDLSEQQLQLARQSSPQQDLSQQLLYLMQEREDLARVADGLTAHIIQETGTRDIARPAFSELITAIQKNDEQTRTFIERSLGELEKKIRLTETSKKAYEAYSPVGSEVAWFIDKKK